MNDRSKIIKRFFELQEKVLSYYPDANIELLKKAYSVAADAHLNQTRASNEPYIVHPLEVAGMLADMRLDEISIAAGLLHDVVEDSRYRIEDITELFGEEISGIVWGVTKISKISAVDADNAKAETLKKMIIAMTKDVRVILIKLADRYHNILTLGAFRPDKQKRIARETLEIYAPIAYRLGMGKIKTELEDIAFQFAYPDEYKEIYQSIHDNKDWATSKLEEMKSEIQKILDQFNISGDICYRMKREISIYRKISKQNITIDKVYDLLALRIITNSIENCYAIMGEIHQRWLYIPSRLRDFIANQKNNGYQSIHTTIITHDGSKFEVQIRTEEMHKIAEEGIAAHWKYKEGISFIEDDQRLQWFRDMIETHKENPNPKDFLSLVKGDLTPNEIFVFTPKGKVVTLKAGSTPIDFAYSIHTEVGHQTKGAIVNEQMVPLRTPLDSGDVVEILIHKNGHPSRDWLKFAVTNRARKKIMAYFLKKDYSDLYEKGKRLWTKILREYQKSHNLKITEDEIKKRISETFCTDMDTFFRSLGGNNKILDRRTLKKLFPEVKTKEIKSIDKIKKKGSPFYRLVSVEGCKDIDVKFARCCNPIKGDSIMGYITTKRGLMIHRQDCPTLQNVMNTRLKNVEWTPHEEYSYRVRFDLFIQDKPGLLSLISSVTANHSSNINKVETERISQSLSKIKITFEVKDTAQLQKIASDFRQIKGVQTVVRKRIIED